GRRAPLEARRTASSLNSCVNRRRVRGGSPPDRDSLRFDVITQLRPEPTSRVIEVSTKSGEGHGEVEQLYEEAQLPYGTITTTDAATAAALADFLPSHGWVEQPMTHLMVF